MKPTLKEQKLIDFGNEALYSGKDYAFQTIKMTKEQTEFANYLFSENRKTVVKDSEKQKTVQPEDLKAFAGEPKTQKSSEKEPNTEANKKPAEKPKDNPK